MSLLSFMGFSGSAFQSFGIQTLKCTRAQGLGLSFSLQGAPKINAPGEVKNQPSTASGFGVRFQGLGAVTSRTLYN